MKPLVLSLLGLHVVLCAASEVRAQKLIYTFQSTSKSDGFGHAVAVVGDTDKDGVSDIAVGAPYADINGQDSGSIKVYSGRTGKVLLTVNGAKAGDHFGTSIHAAGDLNGDGYADIIAGAPSASAQNGGHSGSIRVISGQTGKDLLIAHGGGAWFSFGLTVGLVGDINGDKIPDLLVAAPGAGQPYASRKPSAHVISGKDGKFLRSVEGSSVTSGFGYSLSGVGDVDRDGTPDFAVGARNSGQVKTFSGKDGKVLFTFQGSGGDNFGHSVCSPGDTNKDGYPDILVGAPQSGSTYPGPGYAALYSGKDGRLLYTHKSSSPVANLGLSVASVGDLDQDGHPDYIIGGERIRVPPDPNCRTFCAAKSFAKLLMFSGRTNSLFAELKGPIQNTGGGYFGTGLSHAVDLNGDGDVEIAVSSPQTRKLVEVITINFARYSTFGRGCSSSASLPTLLGTRPSLGKDFELRAQNVPPVTFGLMLTGVSKTQWSGQKLPLRLSFMGMSGCELLVSWDLQVPLWTGGGTAVWKVRVPDSASLLGVNFYNQFWVRDPKANLIGIAVSNGGQGRLGQAP